MRVLHVYKNYPPVIGGIEGHLRLLATRQAARGLEVTVLTTSLDRTTSLARDRGVQVIRAGRLAHVLSTPISLALLAHLRTAQPDVVHVHMPYPVAEIGEWLLGGGRPYVVTYHSDVVRQRAWARVLSPLRSRFLRQAHCVLVTSSAYLSSSVMLQQVRDRCRVVPLGVDIERFASASVASLGEMVSDGPIVLFVGRFRRYKGLSVLIEAMAEVEAKLVLVGDGPERRRLEQQIKRSPAAARIHLVGEVCDADLPGCYAAADIVVLPSILRSEAFSLALVEAMAAATPVVCTELGTGTSEVNEHGVTGLVVPPADAGALAAALGELLADPVRRRRMGRAAARRARECFSAERMVDATVQAYESACLKMTDKW